MLYLVPRGIAGHWKGTASLVFALGINVLALRFVVFKLLEARPPDLSFALAMGLSAASAAVLVWQIIGAIRCVDRSGGPGNMAPFACYVSVLIAVILFAVAEVNHFASRNAPGPLAHLPVKDESLWPVVYGTMRLKGDIGFSEMEKFERTLRATPGIRRVELNSQGGLIQAARAIAIEVEAHELDTMATGLCASACTLVFAAGHNRSLGPKGALGFHGYRFAAPHPAFNSAGHSPFYSIPEEEKRDRDFLARRGISPEFIARAYAVPHDTIWTPSPADLHAAGVLTAD